MKEDELALAQSFKENCFEALAEEGYRPKTDQNRIWFEINRKPFYVWFSREYTTLYQMMTFDEYETSALSHEDALKIANDWNTNFIDAKAIVMPSDYKENFTVIMFRSECHIPDCFDTVFRDKLKALQESVRCVGIDVSAHKLFNII